MEKDKSDISGTDFTVPGSDYKICLDMRTDALGCISWNHAVVPLDGILSGETISLTGYLPSSYWEYIPRLTARLGKDGEYIEVDYGGSLNAWLYPDRDSIRLPRIGLSYASCEIYMSLQKNK